MEDSLTVAAELFGGSPPGELGAVVERTGLDFSDLTGSDGLTSDDLEEGFAVDFIDSDGFTLSFFEGVGFPCCVGEVAGTTTTAGSELLVGSMTKTGSDSGASPSPSC